MKRERHIHPDNAVLAALDQVTDTRQARMRRVVAHRQRGLLVMMEAVNNPYNLAAIVRSCDAFGIQQLAYTVSPEHTFDPKLAGGPAATSASKWLDYRAFSNGTTDALLTLKAEGWTILAAVADERAPAVYSLDLTQPPQLALLVGNEQHGLSADALALADSHTTIPMHGMIQSFNVSVATAILLYEIVRQRQISPQTFALTPDEQTALMAEFARRSAQPRRARRTFPTK